MIYDCLSTFLHEPLRSRSCATDTYGLTIFNEREVYLVATLYVVGVGVSLEALLVEHLTITALLTTNEEDEVVLLCKAAYIVKTIRHLATDGVVVIKLHARGYTLLDSLYDEA